MALNSQGLKIRRESTVTNSTGYTSTNTISFDAANKKIIRNVAGSFITENFASGMRIEISGSTTANNGAFTLNSVQAATLVVYETLVNEASGVTKTITGHTMAEIGEITGFSGPGISAAVIDITNLQSTAKEKLVSIQDSGQLTININVDPTHDADLHTSIQEDLRNRKCRMWDIKFTDTGTYLPSAVYFAGYVSGWSMAGGVDKQITGDITIALTSAVMWSSQV